MGGGGIKGVFVKKNCRISKQVHLYSEEETRFFFVYYNLLQICSLDGTVLGTREQDNDKRKSKLCRVLVCVALSRVKILGLYAVDTRSQNQGTFFRLRANLTADACIDATTFAVDT